MKIVWIAAPLLLLGGAAALHSDSSPETVGLSLFFQNSQMPKLTLAGDAKRFLQEIDIVANGAPTTTDQGIQPLIQSGDFANLDWTGVQMVEEDFRPNPDGTFLRQRFYRNATWMKRDTAFAVLPVPEAEVLSRYRDLHRCAPLGGDLLRDAELFAVTLFRDDHFVVPSDQGSIAGSKPSV